MFCIMDENRIASVDSCFICVYCIASTLASPVFKIVFALFCIMAVKIGTIKSRCRAVRNVVLFGFLVVYGMKLYNSILAAKEVSEYEREYSIRFGNLNMSIDFAEAMNYTYVESDDKTDHMACTQCSPLKRRDYSCEGCSPFAVVRIGDVIEHNRKAVINRLHVEMCESNTTYWNLHLFMCWTWIGAYEKLDLYSKPEEMRKELLWNQLFNLLGALMGIWNAFGVIQSLCVQQVQRSTVKREGWTPTTASGEGVLDVRGEIDPYEAARNNTTLRHRL